jgi:hypothetical protein
MLGLALTVANATAMAATLTIVNIDGANEGFNSTLAATPVGGNTATTLGAQRLNVFQRAAEIWGQRLVSTQTIKVEASFDTDLQCGSGQAVLAEAGPEDIFLQTFGTGQRWVPVALREAIANSNLNGAGPEIIARFNSNIDTGCLGAQRWWYGIDPNVPVPTNRISLLNTVLHELGHGLGFISIVCLDSGGCGANWLAGGYPDNSLDRWADFQLDRPSGILWSALGNAQRLTSAANGNQLVWNGTNVTSALSSIPVGNAGLNGGRIEMHTPATLQPGSSVSHFTLDSNMPDLLMEPTIGSTNRNDQLDLSTALLRDIGWTIISGAAPTATQISADAPDPSASGSAYTVSTEVIRLGPIGSVTGTVTVTDGSASCITPALTNGAGSCTLTSVSSGEKTLIATYSGNTTLSPSSDVEAHTVVPLVNTNTVINSDSPDPSLVGQSYTVTVSVARSSGSGTAPTGTVTISEGSNSCMLTLSGGSGSCAMISLLAGSRSLVASYAGALGFNASESTIVSHTVTKASTALSITGDTPDPSVSGQTVAVSFALSVTGAGSGTPTGTVTINGAAGESCVATLPTASCSIVLVNTGARLLSATYSGDVNYNGSTSSSATHTVNKANTLISISADTPDPSVVGQNVSVSAAISVTAPGTGTPGGTVTISALGNPQSCSYTLPATSCALPLSLAGARPLTASYSGNGNFNGSTSNTTPHTVNKANTTLSILSDTPDPSASGAPVTVSFQLLVSAPGSGIPAGSVTISANGGTENCVATLPTSSCELVLQTVGSRQLTANYSGNAHFNAASSINVPHTVSFAPTTTTISLSSPNPSVFGQSYTVLVNVAAIGDPPTGVSVNVSDGADANCTLILDATGNGSCSLTSGSPGIRTLRATFPGAGSFLSSFGTRAHTINKANSTLTLVSDSPDPSNPGQNVNVRFTVVAAAPGAGTVTGNINVSASPTETCNTTLPTTSCVLALTELGERTLTLNYAGDNNFNSAGPLSNAHVVTDVLVDELFVDGFE